MKNIVLIALLLFSIQFSAQSAHGVAVNAGYTYINTNTGYIGGEYTYRIDPANWTGFSVGAGTHFGSFNGDFEFIPEAHLTFSYTLFLAEFSITPHNINPSLGLNIMNGIRLKGGYSWKLGNDNKGMKGITFGLNLLLGTHGFYDQLDIQ